MTHPSANQQHNWSSVAFYKVENISNVTLASLGYVSPKAMHEKLKTIVWSKFPLKQIKD